MIKMRLPLIAAFLLVVPNGWALSRFERGTDTRTLTPEAVMGARKSWGADLSLGGAFDRGNIDLDYLSSGLALFRAFGPATAYLNGAMTYSTFGDRRTINQGTITARYDHRVRGPWKAFVFHTEAYNEFLKLNHRATTGVGPWYDWELGPSKNGTSLAVTHEYERFHGGYIRRTARLSFRHLAAIAVSPTASIRADLYWVPKVGDFRDHRVSAELALETTIWKDLGFKLTWLDEYDSRPRPGVKSNDTHWLTALTFHFGA